MYIKNVVEFFLEWEMRNVSDKSFKQNQNILYVQ
jgi:hypothetical protein